MNLAEILKNAFVFPANNLETLSIYAILSLLSGAFAVEGIITFIFGIVDVWYFVIGGISIAIAIILGLITNRISLQCIKSGIDLEEKLPDFNWLQSFGAGFGKVIITIFYFIIPALIAVFIGLITNIYGNILYLCDELGVQASHVLMGQISVSDAILNAALPFFVSLAITISAALIIFLIFSFFQAMGEARYAHTGSLKQALNIYSAAKDISRIGVGKVIVLAVLIFIIITILESVLAVIFNQFPLLSILTIVITPYLALFGQRALGLLYSDIVDH